MKKVILFVFIVLFTITIAGCGTFSPPIELPEDPIAGENPDAPAVSPEEEEGDVFSVTLTCEGEPFYPTEPIFALWTGDEGVHMAQFDQLGVAKINDLDGEYRVTLSNLPHGYTYDVNGYTVDNTRMSVEIEVLKIVSERLTTASSTDLYHCVTVEELGTYRTAITSSSEWVYYAFQPTRAGRYSIESWADITANDINPQVQIYIGNFAAKYPLRLQDDGGSQSTYTKNFRYEISLRQDELGNVYTFAVRASKIGNTYPVTLDFTIKREGEVEGLGTQYTKITPHHEFSDSTKTKPLGAFRYLYKDSRYILTDNDVYYNESDDYYHVHSKDGPILYAKVSRDSEVIMTDSGTCFLDPLITLKFAGKDYYDFIDYYAAYSNSDGAHPLTKELKEFMFDYSVGQRFFNDGNGWAEMHGLNSTEEDQWLFNCGYYS